MGDDNSPIPISHPPLISTYPLDETYFVRMPMLSILLTSLVAASACDKVRDRFSGPKTTFDGQAALAYAKAQVDFGPRAPGLPGHDKAADWIVAEMKKRTNSVSEQRWTQTTAKGTQLALRNIL